MNYKFVRHIGIKYFPSNILDYLSYCIFNFLFALLFIISAPFLDNIFFKTSKNTYILLIPKITNNFEEKKDLIFSGLSLNADILSVREVEKKSLIKKLNKNMNSDLIQEDLIPEIFEIIIKKNKKLILEKENIKLSNILEGAEIIEKKKDSKDSNLKNILFLSALIFIFVSILFILQIDYIKKIKAFLVISRVFGSKDSDIIYNVSIGYFLFQALGVLFVYFFIFFFENNFKIPLFFLKEYLGSFVIFILMQIIICFFNLVFILKLTLRKVF